MLCARKRVVIETCNVARVVNLIEGWFLFIEFEGWPGAYFLVATLIFDILVPRGGTRIPLQFHRALPPTAPAFYMYIKTLKNLNSIEMFHIPKMFTGHGIPGDIH